MLFFYIVLAAALHHAATAKQTCYFPDGITVDADGFPCNTSSSVTASKCCRTFEACLAGGVCYTQWDSVIYRRSCTDRTFKDPACPGPCLNGNTSLQLEQLILERYAIDLWANDRPVSQNGAIALLQCETGTNPSYCCQNTAASCCSNSNSTFNFIPGDFQGVLDASGYLGTVAAASSTGAGSTVTTRSGNTATSATAQSIPLTSSASSSTTAPSPASSAPNGSSAGKIVGLAVGIPLGITAILALLGVLFFVNRLGGERQRRRQMEAELAASSIDSARADHTMNRKDGAPKLSELAAIAIGHELPSTEQ